jgi:hypothetical protein
VVVFISAARKAALILPFSVSDVLAVSVRARRARSLLLQSNWTGLCLDVVAAKTTGGRTTQAASQSCRRDHVEQGHDSRRTLADVLRASDAPSAIDYLAIDATKGGDMVLEVRMCVSAHQHRTPTRGDAYRQGLMPC